MMAKFNIILFGPQGCGKGSQARLLAKRYKLYHLSMGDELRKEIKNKTVIGKKSERLMNKGLLVPSSITNRIALNKLRSKECRNGIIFDGYPRSSDQWDFMKKHIKIDAAIELEVPLKTSLHRIATRRVCPKCSRNYNIIYIKPKVAGKCDVCNVPLIHRDDDKPLEIRKRLKTYKRQTEPLRKEYKRLGILYKANGNQPINDVDKDLRKILERIRKEKK
jgi:adenylate kinase